MLVDLKFHPAGRPLEMMAATDETIGVNVAEERAERAERREVLLLDWMEREIWILKGGGSAV